MKTHQAIEKRSLAIARATAAKIDADANRTGLQKARSVCRRWYAMHRQPAVSEWLKVLKKPWREVRSVLLDESEAGTRMRQNSPFCGILTNRERWRIYRQSRQYDT